MGWRSREHLERRGRRTRDDLKDLGRRRTADQQPASRADALEDEIRRLMEGDTTFWTSKDLPPDVRESNLEDILAFESVGSGLSLFDGLQEHGIDLPPPGKLDEDQSADKVMEVTHALARLGIFLVGWEGLTAREFYSTLWNQTLWEGCYVEKRNPGALTLIDISHKMSASDLQQFVEELQKSCSVQ